MKILIFLISLCISNAFAEEAIVAGGCFWCIEADMEKLSGVTSVVSGYTDGHKKNPTYKEVSSGSTGHTEAIKIVFDSKIITYQKIIEHFWRSIDPFAQDQQFCDKGTQYRAGIYYLNDTQRKIAESSLQKVNKKFAGKRIYTEIKKASTFYPAEDYHQDYYKKNPIRYKYYRFSCGRDKRTESIWGAK